MLGKRIGNINLMETTLCFAGTTDLKKRVCSTSVLYSKELAIPVSQEPVVTFVLIFRYKESVQNKSGEEISWNFRLSFKRNNCHK